MLKMKGTPENRIKLEGTGNGKGLWRGIEIHYCFTDNELDYVDILNAGSRYKLLPAIFGGFV